MKSGTLLNTAIIFTWIGLLFASQATDPQSFGFQIIYQPLQNFYNTGASNTFPGFEVISFLLIIGIFLHYERNSKIYFPDKLLTIFISITILFVVISLINPKNAIEKGYFALLKMRIARTIIYYAISVIVIFTLNTVSYIDFIKRFAKIGLYIGSLRAILDIVGFVTSTGVINYYGRHITTYGGDIQLWFSIFSVFSFSIFLYHKNKKFLYISLIFLVCLLFSYQRTAFFVTLIFYITFYTIYLFLFSKNFIKSFSITLFAISIIFMTMALLFNTTIGKDIYLRLGSALAFTGYVAIENNSNDPEYSDSGHFEQSKNVSEFLIKNLSDFWGGGINRRNENYLLIEGQSKGGVHNNIASLWQYFGIPGLLYFLWLSIFVISYYIKILSRHKQINFNRFMILAISNYFIIRFIAGWFSGDFFYMYYQICFQYIILFSFYKLYYKKDIFIKPPNNELLIKQRPSIHKINTKVQSDIEEGSKIKI